MKKHLKKICVALGIFAIIYSVINDVNYIFNLLNAIICLVLISVFVLVIRNLRVSKTLFGYRFVWFYPLITFFSLTLYIGLKLLFNGGVFGEEHFLSILIIGFVVGEIWGFTEWRHITSLNDLDELSEYVAWVDSEFNTKKKGVLSLLPDKSIHFVVAGEKELVLLHSDIQKIHIKKEYLIFPSSLSILLKDGTSYFFESEFPYVWAHEIAK